MIHRMSPGETGRCQNKNCDEKREIGKEDVMQDYCKGRERLNSTGEGDVAGVKLEFTDLAHWRVFKSCDGGIKATCIC